VRRATSQSKTDPGARHAAVPPKFRLKLNAGEHTHPAGRAGCRWNAQIHGRMEPGLDNFAKSPALDPAAAGSWLKYHASKPAKARSAGWKNVKIRHYIRNSGE